MQWNIFWWTFPLIFYKWPKVLKSHKKNKLQSQTICVLKLTSVTLTQPKPNMDLNGDICSWKDASKTQSFFVHGRPLCHLLMSFIPHLCISVHFLYKFLRSLNFQSEDKDGHFFSGPVQFSWFLRLHHLFFFFFAEGLLSGSVAPSQNFHFHVKHTWKKCRSKWILKAACIEF